MFVHQELNNHMTAVTDKSSLSQARLRWHCRRGMLELDLILGPFLEQQFPSLIEEEQAAFAKLLASPDQYLYDWLVAKNSVPELTLRPIVKRILNQ